MNKIVTGALAALTLGGAIAATTVPAEAQPFRGGYSHGGGYGYRGPGVGAAVGAGILGLAVGAAIAHPAYAYPAYAYPAAPYYAPGPYYGPAPYYAPAYGYAPVYGYGYGYHPYGRHYGYRHW
jgi:hypothetical protein